MQTQQSTLWLASAAVVVAMSCGDQPAPRNSTYSPQAGRPAATGVVSRSQPTPSTTPVVASTAPVVPLAPPPFVPEPPEGLMKEHAAAIDREASEYIRGVFAAVQVAKDAGFKPLGSDAEFKAQFPHAYYDSYYGIGVQGRVRPGVPPLFRADRHPYVPDLAATRSYYSGDPKTWDVIRHELTIDSQKVVVFETVNDVLVVLAERGRALVSMAPAARVAELVRVATHLFDDTWSKAKWTPRGSSGDATEVAFTTAPTVVPDDPPAGRFRMDAIVRKGDLCFLYYKTHNEQRMNRLRKGVRWFQPKKK